MKRPYFRALLAPAAVAASIALAGCNADGISPTGRAQAPLSEKTLALMSEKNMDKGSPILARIFKNESEMEVWKQTRDGRYALLKTYPICRWSGELGPKRKQGDRQAPEGFYTITPGQMNPNSSFYLAFNTGFPNAYDRAWDRTGSDLMVHGDCSSRGCYAMTDEQMQEIYALARESFFGGQKAFQLQAFPFRMTAINMAKHRNNPNFAFWKMLKQGYDHFNATHQEPKVAVCEKRYVFDAAAPENASRPLSFNARGKCPVYQIDPQVADAVLNHRRQEEVRMAGYIADGVATAPITRGVDGGMNPVFVAKLGGTADIYEVAGSSAPGALPRIPNPPGTAMIPQPAAEPAPVVLASVPVPAPAPQAKEGSGPSQARGLFSNLFGGQSDETPAATTPAATADAGGSETVGLRGSNTDLAARPRRSSTSQTAAAAPSLPQAKPPVPAPQPRAVARAAEPAPTPDPTPPARQATAQAEPPRATTPEMRSAFSAAPRPSGMLAGAQPVVPAGSFDSRWSGLR